MTKKKKKYPDGRGKRPKETNKLVKWIVEQSTKNPPSDTSNAENISK